MKKTILLVIPDSMNACFTKAFRNLAHLVVKASGQDQALGAMSNNRDIRHVFVVSDENGLNMIVARIAIGRGKETIVVSTDYIGALVESFGARFVNVREIVTPEDVAAILSPMREAEFAMA